MYFPNRQYLQVVTSYLFHNILLFHSLQSSLFLVLSTVRDCSEPEDSCRLKCCGQVTVPSLYPKATFVLDSTGENIVRVQHDFTNPQCKFAGSNGEFECVTESAEKCHYQNFTCVVTFGLRSFSALIEIPLDCK